MKEPRIASTCSWHLCAKKAVKERWDPHLGVWRRSCAQHVADATPFELRDLPTQAPAIKERAPS